MHFNVRALTATLVSITALTTAACGGGGGGGNNGGSGAGNSNSSGGMDWSGTWSAELSYHVDCDVGFGNMKSADWSQTDALTLEDDGSGGIAVSFPDASNYQMAGNGSAQLLTLSGPYPAKDDAGSAASIVASENTVSIKLDKIDGADSASGKVSGQFKGQFGQDCSISGGTVSFSR